MGGMSCFSCLFGPKPESGAGQPPAPAPPAANAAPSPAAHDPSPTPGAAAAAVVQNGAVKSTVQGTAGANVTEKVPRQPEGEPAAKSQDATPALEQEAASRPPAADPAAATAAESGSALATNGGSAETHDGGDASEGASVSVVGEVGVVGKGSNHAASFQARATPRTVFGQGAQEGESSAVDTSDVGFTEVKVAANVFGVSGGWTRPLEASSPTGKGVSPSQPAPPGTGGAGPGAHASNGWTAERPPIPPRNRVEVEHGELMIVGGLHSSEVGPSGEEGAAAGEVTVRDGDEECKPGTAVMVSVRWTQVAYFQQFAEQQGVLTRRGPHGGTWYACFPGSQEVAFSTGMHGQFVLAYSTLPTPHSPAPSPLEVPCPPFQSRTPPNSRTSPCIPAPLPPLIDAPSHGHRLATPSLHPATPP